MGAFTGEAVRIRWTQRQPVGRATTLKTSQNVKQDDFGILNSSIYVPCLRSEG